MATSPAEPSSTSAIFRAVADAASAGGSDWSLRDPHRAVSIAELHALATARAGVLAEAGLGPGRLVLAEAAHSVDYLVSYLALLGLGCHLMPWDPAAGEAELEREVSRFGVEFVLRAAAPGAAAPPVPQPTGQLPRSAALPAEPLVLLPTSGTGGLPKRAVHREAGLLGNARAHAASVQLTGQDTCLVSLSPAFGYCHTAQVLAALVTGGRLVLPPRPALPAELAALIERYRVTTTTMVPHQLSDAMLRALGSGGSLRQLVLGGSAVLPETAQRVRSALPGVELVQTWGMTEAGPRLTTWRSRRDQGKAACAGLPIDGVRIAAADADGRLPEGFGPPGLAAIRFTAGELVATTPYLMWGYLDAPEETAAAVPQPGVLRTGDLGTVGEDGQVRIDGRLKNLIDVSGKKVAPEEIESVLLELPGVAEVRVVAEADARRGQQPVAYVVAGAHTPLDPRQVQAYVRARLARHKWLSRVELVERIDRTTTGKVRRW